MSDKIEKYIYPTQTAVKIRNAKCSIENMKMETPSHAEIARGSYLLTRDSSSSELMWKIVPSAAQLQNWWSLTTATFLCQKLRNFCLNSHFKLGNLTLCQITSISLMPHVRLLTGNPGPSKKPIPLVWPLSWQSSAHEQEICLGWCLLASCLEHYSLLIIWKLFLSSLCTKLWQISSDVRSEKAFLSVPAKEYCGEYKNR